MVHSNLLSSVMRCVLANEAGETGCTVCGYMGLDGGSAEAQKLSFEEQPDSRVRRGKPSRQIPICPLLGEGGAAFPPPADNELGQGPGWEGQVWP